VLNRRWMIRSGLIALVVGGLVPAGQVQAIAGPQDDPPVQITPGATFLPTGENTLTLTLDSSGHAGDLEPGAIQAAKQVAATVNAAPGSGADPEATTGGGGGSPSQSADPGSGSGVSSGECSWRDASSLPATADAWGGNDPTAGDVAGQHL
jgi:hypothetical protein